MMGNEKFTKGPWRWEVNNKSKNVELCGRGIEVLRFQRWGMQDAAPTFTKADDTFKLQGAKVSDLLVDIKGREHHSDWIQTIDHPDAHLIAAAPEMYYYLSMQLRDIETLRDDLLGDDDYESLFTGDKATIDSYTMDIIGISKLLAKARGE